MKFKLKISIAEHKKYKFFSFYEHFGVLFMQEKHQSS